MLRSNNSSWQGIAVSPGVAIGPALVLERRRAAVARKDIAAGESVAEIERLSIAVRRAAAELEDLKERADEALGHGVAQIFDAQLLLLEDSMFVGEVQRRIRDKHQNAEWAVRRVGRDLSARLSSIADVYLRERGTDVDDITERLLRALLGEEGHRLDQLVEPVVLFAHDLTPSETAQLDPEKILGFATDAGSRTSHTAIVARTLEIPAVVGLHDITSSLQSGDTVVINGDAGVVIVSPPPEVLDDQRQRRDARALEQNGLLSDRDLPATTRDGFVVSMLANIDSASEAASALDRGAEGVGLFRSEYLFLRNPGVLPTEDEHYAEYRAVLERMGSRPVSIRTLDIGGEKLMPMDPSSAGSRSETLLGLRALRLALREREVFSAQLRGLLRASVHGNLQIMLPFVSGIEELREARRHIDRVYDQLAEEGHEVAPDIPIGVMLEVPSAALTVDLLAREADFLAIGSNDLIQYTLAVDRSNDAVAHLYEPLHPAILRLLKRIAEEARAQNVPLSMCGEMAADPLTAMMLLGFGIDQLSMNPVTLPLIKRVLRRLRREDAERALQRALELETAEQIEAATLPVLLAVLPDLGKNGT